MMATGTTEVAAAGRGQTVLIADDDLAIVDALGMLLEGEGYAVAMVTGGDVVAQTRDARPGIVLLDIRLSGQDGAEICRALKGTAETTGVPVVIVSANPDGAAIAREAGADAFLAKPFDMDDLLNLIAAHIVTPD